MKTTQITKQASRNIKVRKTSAKAAKALTAIWFYVMTPSSMKLLRAYFLACIHAQNAFKVGAPFRLWGGANLSTHVASGKLTRSNGIYALTAPGLNYFTDPAQAPDADMLKRFIAAVTTGKGASDYANTSGKPYEMIKVNLA